MDVFDEPDHNNQPQVSALQSNYSEEIPIEVQAHNTPINTISFFDEPDPNIYTNTMLIQQESSASPPPPPPAAALVSDSIKAVDVIPEDTEKDEYRDEKEEDDDDDDDDDDDEDIAKLERDLEAIKTKLDQIKIENMVFTEEMCKSVQHTSLTAEYDEKIMEYDKEFNEQQRIIEEEQRLIEQYEKEFNDKLTKHNMKHNIENDNFDKLNDSMSTDHLINGIIRNGKTGQTGGKHAQKSSIVLYDNSFAINHQLQCEIDKLIQQIQWLQKSKIQLVKNTATEVDRLRLIIKHFQQ